MGSMRTFVTDGTDGTDGGYFKGPNGVGPKTDLNRSSWTKKY